MAYEEAKKCPSCGSGYVARQLEKGLCWCNSCGVIWDVPKKPPDPEPMELTCSLCGQPFLCICDPPGPDLCPRCSLRGSSIVPEPEPPKTWPDVKGPWEEDG